MNTGVILSDQIATLLVRELDGFSREVSMFPDDVSLWQTVPGITNSAGNLALHVAGNLEHFVGALLGGSGYVRDREAEFSRRSGTRAEMVLTIHKAAATVRGVLGELPVDKLSEEFPEPIMGLRIRTDLFLMHLCAHAAFHLGQAGYVRRAATGNSETSGPLPLKPLAF